MTDMTTIILQVLQGAGIALLFIIGTLVVTALIALMEKDPDK